MKKFIDWFVKNTVEGSILDNENATTKEKLITWCACCLMIVSIPTIFIGSVYLACVKQPTNTNEYYRSAEVFRIENEVVYLEDTQGYVWCVEDDTLQMFGRYILVMDNCGTDDITDDEILRIE